MLPHRIGIHEKDYFTSQTVASCPLNEVTKHISIYNQTYIPNYAVITQRMGKPQADPECKMFYCRIGLPLVE